MLFLMMYMISVGFFMYIERKFLGLGQYREGPNKVLFKGYFQFVYDMFKLFIKDLVEVYNMFILTYLFMPFLLFLNMFLMWMLLPVDSMVVNTEISMVYLIVLMVLKMYYLVLMVFYIYSFYSYMSMIRMIIQIISYDIVIILVILFNFVIYVDFNFEMFVFISESNIFMNNLVVMMFWVISVMVELIRLPFDFYEGESELISGFNLEYSSFLFLILVLVEYMEMIYFLLLTLIMFFSFYLFSMMYLMLLLFLIFILIWFRVFFVRYRIDKMLLILWKFIFPFMMLFLFMYYFLGLL